MKQNINVTRRQGWDSNGIVDFIEHIKKIGIRAE
jgi:hypothetical protein